MKNHVGLFCLLMSFGVVAIQAKNPADYHIGDVVAEDIVTPVALEVVDPAATAALKSSQSAQVPAVFKSYPVATNAVAAQFDLAFANAQSNFINAVQETFHQTSLDQPTVASQDFGYLITAFNIKNKDFPVTATLATDWALGKGGNYEKKLLQCSLLWAVQCKIRPDEMPEGFGAGEVVRLVPGQGRKTGPIGLQGKLASNTDLVSISQARSMFRRAFVGYDEEPLTRVLAAWIKPNCIPDAELTRQAREQATSELVVMEHYTAGQVIAQEGSVVDEKMKAAFDQLEGKVTSAFNSQPAAADVKTMESPVAAVEQPPAAVQPAPLATPAQEVQDVHSAPDSSWKTFANRSPRVLVLAAISIISALVFISVMAGKLIFRRREPKTLPTTALQTQLPMAMQTALAPELVMAVREALVQELAGQRRELMVVQQNAAVEVSRLVRKMDDMQMQLQERLKVYELQINRLESELAARTEENQELIKMKIEMIRRQRESETTTKENEEHLVFT